MQIDKRASRYLSFFGFVSILIFFQERLRMQIDKAQLGSKIFFFRSNCLDLYLLPRTAENADWQEGLFHQLKFLSQNWRTCSKTADTDVAIHHEHFVPEYSIGCERKTECIWYCLLFPRKALNADSTSKLVIHNHYIPRPVVANNLNNCEHFGICLLILSKNDICFPQTTARLSLPDVYLPNSHWNHWLPLTSKTIIAPYNCWQFNPR